MNNEEASKIGKTILANHTDKALTDKIRVSENDFIDYVIASNEALEKQMPKKPVAKQDGIFGDFNACCPDCKRPINFGLYAPKCCKNCGQAFDWSKKQ